MSPYDAILLAGGAGRRMGGRDKAALVVGGRSLGERVRAAVEGADRVVLVGPERSWLPGCVATQEDPPGAGPLAAVAAGLAHVTRPVVVVVAVDLPFLTPPQVDALRSALVADPAAEAALAVDDLGRDQLLLAAWRVDAARRRLMLLGDLAGRPVRLLYGRSRPSGEPARRAGFAAAVARLRHRPGPEGRGGLA